MPKRLAMNPQTHEIELVVFSREKETQHDYGLATVHFKFGETNGEICFSRPEMEKIGRWFLQLARELKRKPKKKEHR